MCRTLSRPLASAAHRRAATTVPVACCTFDPQPLFEPMTNREEPVMTLRGKGFIRIFQLTVDDFTYQDLQWELECDGIGTTILIKEYAKQDMQALRSGTWVFPKKFTYDYDY